LGSDQFDLDGNGKRPHPFLRDEGVQGLVKAESLPRGEPWSDVTDARALEKYTPALDLLVDGKGLAEAAREGGLSVRSFQSLLYRHPELYREVKHRREIRRELVQVRALALADRQLDEGFLGAEGRQAAVKSIDDLMAEIGTLSPDQVRGRLESIRESLAHREISTRDLTDIYRATKGPAEDPGSRVELVIDL
jgi:hypothetical protein